MTVVDFLMENEIFSSKGEARRAILQQSIKLNGIRVENIEELIPSDVITISRGKRIYLKSTDGKFNLID